ncbi:MAG: hypothetical protein APF84_11965 [Gracilibacter sp. BRH_c7a]|nr:MAG: hypothetical protein APF84_11965 [Gracilibacter sp. BRH_c7a]
MISTLSRIIDQLQNIGATPQELQTKISVSEVWHLWELTSARYDALQETQFLEKLCEDGDFKIVIASGINTLKEQVERKEKIMVKYGIPLPERPPSNTSFFEKSHEINDRYIYRQIFRGIQGFLHIHIGSVSQATDPNMRKLFIDLLKEEVNIFDSFAEYGKLKNWVECPPSLRS